MNQQAFFALLQSGLWEQECRLSQYNDICFEEVYRLAEEQSVVGVIAAGLEHVIDTKVPKEDALTFAGATLQLEQRNTAMNQFIGITVDKMRDSGIYTLLLKGQGIAQSYERPLWRSAGDVDFFLSDDNYVKAKDLLMPLSTFMEEEDPYIKHIGMTIEPWEVELHGNLRCNISRKSEKVLDELKDDVFYGGGVRSWLNGNTQVFLLKADIDVVYVFAHILHHFFYGGIGLRQVCDWCRLIWTSRREIDVALLKSRLRTAGLMSEWYTFACLAANYLGMPVDAIPLYSDDNRWKRKAKMVLSDILEKGNFGRKVDNSFRVKEPFLKRKIIATWRYCKEGVSHFFIFPLDSLIVLCRTLRMGMVGTFKRK